VLPSIDRIMAKTSFFMFSPGVGSSASRHRP
jgi:hypothetical protein